MGGLCHSQAPRLEGRQRCYFEWWVLAFCLYQERPDVSQVLEATGPPAGWFQKSRRMAELESQASKSGGPAW